jgi:hypothetical protein
MTILMQVGNEDSGLSPAVMTIIALLLLMLPYLIRRYTGRSVTDLVHLPVLFEGLERLADRFRNLVRRPFGTKSGEGKRSDGKGKTASEAGPDPAKEERKNRSLEVKREYREKTLEKHRAGNVKNDYLQTVSRLLTFGRKKRLFTIFPGNLQHDGKTADLMAILVTRARVIGINAYGFDQTVHCRKDNGAWQQESGNTKKPIGSLNAENAVQDRIVRDALRAGGLGSLPYETVMVFTSSNVTLSGEKPENVFTQEEFFLAIDTDRDVKEGPLDPRDTGRRIAALKKAGKQVR